MELKDHVKEIEDAVRQIDRDEHFAKRAQADVWLAYDELVEAIHYFRKEVEMYE